MDPQEKEELKKVVYTFLKQQNIAVIATVSAKNAPEAATVSFVIDEYWTLYIFTHKDSRKVANIRLNPNVALVVGTMLVAYTAQMQATAEIIDDSQNEYKLISSKFKDTNFFKKDPIFGALKDNYVMLKMKITWLRWLSFEQLTNKEIYTLLIP